MRKNLLKVFLTAGIIFGLQTTTSAASSEIDKPQKFTFPIKHTEVKTPEFLIGGAVKDVTQKILPISIEARYFLPHLDLNVQSDSIHFNGGKVGLKDTLGFDNDNAPEVIFRYKRFTADYFKIHGTGSREFSSGDILSFGGYDYSGRTTSTSDFQYLKLQVTNPIINVLGSGVDWSYGLSGIYWKGSVSGREHYSGYSVSETKEFGAPIPTLGLGAHASLLDVLIFRAHLSGLPLGGHGHFYDFEAGVRYNPIDLLSISVGYRKIHAQVNYDGDSGTLDMDGPYAGLRFDF